MRTHIIKAINERLTAAAFVKAAMVGVLALGAVAIPQAPLEARGAPESFADLVDELSPAVVNISTVQTVRQRSRGSRRLPEGIPFGDWFDEFRDRDEDREEPTRQARSLGSGFIIAADGYVVTNNHVIAEADEITVTTVDGEEYEAELVGRDARTDLALLKITAEEDFPFVSFGESDASRIGDWVLAIGNPFGLGGSVTAGIISGRNRVVDNGYIDYIQSDAPINRGNSGGPMFNMDGKVIGVNTLIFSPSGGNVGIGFAIPSHEASLYISELKEHGRIRRGWLGVSIQRVTDEIAESLGMDTDEGALISEITPDGPAEAAGLQTGDIILTWDGEPVSDSRSLSRMVARTKIGKPVEVVIFREGERLSVPITTGEFPEELNQREAEREGRERRPDNSNRETVQGMELLPLNNDLRRRFRIEEDVNGVLIGRVASSSAARQAGIRPGTVILRVNQMPVEEVDDVVSAIEDAVEAGRGSILMLIHYRGNTVHIPLRLDTDSPEEDSEN